MKITSSPIIYKTVHYEVLKFNINNLSDLAIIASTAIITLSCNKHHILKL